MMSPPFFSVVGSRSNHQVGHCQQPGKSYCGELSPAGQSGAAGCLGGFVRCYVRSWQWKEAMAVTRGSVHSILHNIM